MKPSLVWLLALSLVAIREVRADPVGEWLNRKYQNRYVGYSIRHPDSWTVTYDKNWTMRMTSPAEGVSDFFREELITFASYSPETQIAADYLNTIASELQEEFSRVSVVSISVMNIGSHQVRQFLIDYGEPDTAFNFRGVIYLWTVNRWQYGVFGIARKETYGKWSSRFEQIARSFQLPEGIGRTRTGIIRRLEESREVTRSYSKSQTVEPVNFDIERHFAGLDGIEDAHVRIYFGFVNHMKERLRQVNAQVSVLDENGIALVNERVGFPAAVDGENVTVPGIFILWKLASLPPDHPKQKLWRALERRKYDLSVTVDEVVLATGQRLQVSSAPVFFDVDPTEALYIPIPSR